MGLHRQPDARSRVREAGARRPGHQPVQSNRREEMCYAAPSVRPRRTLHSVRASASSRRGWTRWKTCRGRDACALKAAFEVCLEIVEHSARLIFLVFAIGDDSSDSAPSAMPWQGPRVARPSVTRHAAPPSEV